MLAHPFLETCRNLYPGITLKLVEGFSSLINEWLLSGSIELAILYGPPSGNVVTHVPLLTEDLFAIGAATPEIATGPSSCHAISTGSASSCLTVLIRSARWRCRPASSRRT